MKKILSLLLSLVLTSLTVTQTLAATNPTVLYELDCQTSDNTVKVGFVSDPDTPSAGPEIIAFRLVFQLIPSVSSTVSELKNVVVEANQADYDKLIVAENEVEEESSYVRVTLAGGFTDQEGLKQVDDLFFFKGLNENTYRIKISSGEMYEKGNTNNIFNVPTDFFSVDPSTCPGAGQTTSGTSSTSTSSSTATTTATQQSVSIDNMAYSPAQLTVPVGTQVVWTNNDNVPHTVTSDSGTPLNSGTLSPGRSYRYTFSETGTFTYRCNIHPTTMQGTITVTDSGAAQSTSTTSGSTTTSSTGTQASTTSTEAIEITVDKSSPSAGEEVTVTAMIQDRQGNSIDWTQTAGKQIQPTINNQELDDGRTQSDLVFSMPADTPDITVKVTVGNDNESITIPGNVTRGAADEPATGVQETSSLQERLAARRAEQQAAAAGAEGNDQVQQPSNVHAAAGGLTDSGPAETGLLVVGSLLLAYAWRKAQRRLEV